MGVAVPAHMNRRISQLVVVSSLVGVAMVGGAVVAQDVAAESLKVTFNTTSHGGRYANQNVGAVWIEDANGKFVKTIEGWYTKPFAGRDISKGRRHLLAWIAKAGNADTDAVSSATLSDHSTLHTASWDMKDKSGAAVANGTYTIRMELADSNSSQASQNAQGTFTFNKNGTSASTTGGSNGGFVNVAIDYSATGGGGGGGAACNNGTVDAGETCDGNCPTTCASTNACEPAKLTGSAAACNAKCEFTKIIACLDGDGCCAAGCDESTDSDCGAGGANGGGGGCQSSESTTGGIALLGLFGAAVLLRRRRAAR